MQRIKGQKINAYTLDRGNSRCKGLEVGPCLAYMRSRVTEHYEQGVSRGWASRGRWW